MQGSDTQAVLMYSERDLLVISALASGSTHAEIGELLGITPKAVENWIRKNKLRIKPAAAVVANVLRGTKARVKGEVLENFMDEIKKLDTLSLETLKDALMSENEQLAYMAGREQRDRRMGAPKSSVKIEGKVDHTHTMEIPKEVLALMQQDLVRDRAFMQRAEMMRIGSGDVIDVRAEPGE